MGNWDVKQYDKYDSLKKITFFLLGEYVRIFGTIITEGRDCVIINDPNENTPLHKYNGEYSQITLAQEKTTYWAQTIYQLSHELCHYALSQNKINKNITTSWFEEIVCEAVSLYILKYSAENWSKCLLYKENPTFDKAILDYLKDKLSRKGTNKFVNAIKNNQLKEYDKIAQDDRESRLDERNILFRVIVRNPENLKVLCNYQRYTADDVYIDFDEWYDDNPCEILTFFKNIMSYKDIDFNVLD